MTMNLEPAPALSLGAVLGDSDPHNMAWRRAVGTFSAEVRDARSGIDAPLRLNVVYRVDGKLIPLDFQGVRIIRYDKANGRLLIHAAISKSEKGASRPVLKDLLHDAIEAAEKYAQDRSIVDNLSPIREIFDSLP